jgi:hypothetical protein
MISFIEHSKIPAGKTAILLLLTNLLFSAVDLTAQQNYRIYINEYLTSNVTIDADMVDFDDYSDWIELYNDEDFDVDLGGYFLTDNFNNPSRWKIPEGTIINSKGFLRFWADGYDEIPGTTHRRNYYPFEYFTTKFHHLNFSLSRGGEEIALFNRELVLVDSVKFGYQLPDVSMGRKPDGAAGWYYFGEPTPEASNITEGILTTEYSGEPVISLESGFYSGSQLVSITGTTSGVIKYTLDGSKPSGLSATYTNPLQIYQTTVLNARVFEQNKLPGEIITKTYFIDENISLPVISLAVQPDVLWDNTYGIYSNNFKEREVPVNIEFFEPGGISGFKLNAGLRLTGQASLFYPQKSFTISTDDRFGTDEIIYQVFDQRDMNLFTSIYLRNAGVPDNRSTFFRDALQHSLVINKIDIDCQAYLPSTVFINGNYWGIYNLRDKIDKAYLSSLHNINPDDVDLLEYESAPIPYVMEGNADNFNTFYSYIKENDLSVEENYRHIEQWMDTEEFINYQICEIFYDNVFWPDQNLRLWRERKEGAKWRWILHDLDYGFGMPNQRSIGYRNNTLKFATSSNYGDPFVPPLWSTMIFRKLLANVEFKIKFIQRFSAYLNTVFHPDTIITHINQLQGNISQEMPRHINRWRIGEYFYGDPIRNYSEWIENVMVMRNFAINRHIYQRQHIVEYFGLPGTSTVTINIENEDMGRVIINNVELLKKNRTGIHFKDIPIEIKAIPEVGYKFVKWLGISDEYQNPLRFTLGEDITLTAQFEPVNINLLPAVLSVNTILQKSNSPYYAAGDIKVEPGITLSIEEGVEILMPERGSIIVNGQIIIEGSEELPVIIRPNETSGSWGALCIVNATDSSFISNLKIVSATRGTDFTRDMAALSGYKSNLLLENLIVEDVQAPVFIQYGNVAVKGCTLQTRASGDLINIKHADYALIENCVFTGNNAYDSDAIDFDDITIGIIRNNKIYNLYGPNSDAIDLGEGCKDVLIEGNIIYNIADKGVSIGGGSKGKIRRNIIANCDMGIGIKDYQSYGYIEQNTFYANRYGIASYEKNIGSGGGSADVVNCIIVNSKSASLYTDNLSYIHISYSLSNTDNLVGMHNIIAEPQFLNNFNLSISSPAINKGDPSLPYDPDGSIADMGVYPFDQYKQNNFIINEIHYNPAEGENYKFVEIVNAGSTSVNISNFYVDGDISYRFGNVLIAPGEYFILTGDKSLYEGNGYKVYQWESGTLQKEKGNISLNDQSGNIMDFVNYDNKYWWPKEPDGQGPSLELQNISLENMVSHSWRSSYSTSGTPGKSNNLSQLNNLYINEFLTSNSSVNSDEYGDYDDWIEIFNKNSFPVNIGGLYITDNLDNPLKYQIPMYLAEKTTIPPMGYLLLWADDQTAQGVLHLSFKLDKEGEQIGLVQLLDSSIIFIDSLSYSTQTNNISYGRLPDGSDNWTYFSKPTPSGNNSVTNIEDEPSQPLSYSLSQNYPNPFNPVTIINYQIPQAGLVILKIYDLIGSEVAIPVKREQQPGYYKVELNLSHIPSGIYFYRLQAGSYSETRKMILIK